MQKAFPSETSRAKAFKTVEEQIVKKSLDVIVLKAVKEETLSGYEIILLIRSKFGVKLSAGTVYSL
jgi:DNA-binding PadR family transcriptional regulator